MSPVGGPALEGWDHLPPHLREALTGALEGLSGAYLDLSHPMSPAMQTVWDVCDQIEEWILAQHGEVSAFWE